MLKKIGFVSFLLFICSYSHGQKSPLEKIAITYDQIVGPENTGLYNGTEFVDLYRNTNGTSRFLDGFDYTKGSVIYREQFYGDVLLKYDLLEDQLLTKSNDNLSIFDVSLLSEFISAFTLKDKHFKRLSILGPNEFFEVGYTGREVNLYIKHKKLKRERVEKSAVQYQFKPVNYYLFENNGKFSQIESIGNLRREFPKIKSQIMDFYRSYKPLYKQDRDGFMKKIAAYMDNLPEIQNP